LDWKESTNEEFTPMRLCLLLFVVPVVLGCQSAEDPTADIVPLEVDGLAATIAIAPSVIEPTIPARITTTIRNQSGISRAVPKILCRRGFEVVDQSGQLVTLSGIVCPRIPIPSVVLQPGESHAYVQEWDGRDAERRFVPGNYRVYAVPFRAGHPVGIPISLVVKN
jgi:hypothetical protein